MADLSLEAYRLKKRPSRCPTTPPVPALERRGEGGSPCQSSPSPLPKRKVLRGLGIPKSTYYRWLRRQDHQRLENQLGGGKPAWNRLTFQEVHYVLSAARQMPELISRQLAGWITDNQGFSVLESTVYRILRRAGLVKRPEMRLAAGKEYHRKPTGPHQMWATDASYFRVVGWDYYSMVTVMDDYSRFNPGSQASAGHDSRLLHRGGPGGGGQDWYGSSSSHRPHQAAERQRPWLCLKSLQRLPGDARHQAHPGNPLPPSDVLRGRRQEILQHRKEVQARTIERRWHYNKALRELSNPPSNT